VPARSGWFAWTRVKVDQPSGFSGSSTELIGSLFAGREASWGKRVSSRSARRRLIRASCRCSVPSRSGVACRGLEEVGRAGPGAVVFITDGPNDGGRAADRDGIAKPVVSRAIVREQLDLLLARDRGQHR